MSCWWYIIDFDYRVVYVYYLNVSEMNRFEGKNDCLYLKNGGFIVNLWGLYCIGCIFKNSVIRDIN